MRSTIFYLACLIIIIAGLKAASDIVVPMLLTVFFAIITAPAYLALLRRGVPSVLALIIMIVFIGVFGFFGVELFAKSLKGFSGNIPKYQASLSVQLAHVWDMMEANGIDAPNEFVAEYINPQKAISFMGGLASALSGTLAKALLIFVVVIFILLETSSLPNKIKSIDGVDDETWNRLSKTVDDVRKYLSLKTMMSLLTGILVTIWLTIMDVDYPILLGVIAFMLNYVPTVGSIIAGIPGVLLAFVQFGLGPAGFVMLGYFVVNIGVSNLLEPKFFGKGLGVSPLIIILSMIFWGWVFGPVGMLLSVPLTMTVKVALEANPRTHWIAILMGQAVEEAKPEIETD